MIEARVRKVNRITKTYINAIDQIPTKCPILFVSGATPPPGATIDLISAFVKWSHISCTSSSVQLTSVHPETPVLTKPALVVG